MSEMYLQTIDVNPSIEVYDFFIFFVYHKIVYDFATITYQLSLSYCFLEVVKSLKVAWFRPNLSSNKDSIVKTDIGSV